MKEIATIKFLSYVFVYYTFCISSLGNQIILYLNKICFLISLVTDN